jgi:hypothetical protein
MDIIEKAKLTQQQEWKALKRGVPFEHQNEKSEKDDSEETKGRWPDPIHHQAYYGIAGDLVKLIEPHTEADPVALLVSFLTAVGSVLGNQAHFRVEADRHPARLFCTLVGESSKARKGVSWGHTRRVLGSVDPEWELSVQSGLSSGEGLIWAVRDAIIGSDKNGEPEITDIGVNDKRLLIVESEFASTLKMLSREGNILSATIRNAWDTGNLQTMTKSSQAKATNSHISIIGHITKPELLKYLTSTETSNGFGNRFMWFCIKRSKCLPFGGNINEDDFTAIILKITDVIHYSRTIEEVQWAEETRPMWAFIYPYLSEGKPGLLGSMTARAEANVTRLALIYALLDQSTLIQPIHLRAALALWAYAENSARYIFREMTGNEDADAIVEALITSPEGLTRTDVSQFFGRHKTSEVIGQALDLLISLGKVKKEKVPTEGRSKDVYKLTNQREQGLASLNSLFSQSKYVEMIDNKFGLPHP